MLSTHSTFLVFMTKHHHQRYEQKMREKFFRGDLSKYTEVLILEGIVVYGISWIVGVSVEGVIEGFAEDKWWLQVDLSGRGKPCLSFG